MLRKNVTSFLYSRIKRSASTEEWIGRCEETIKLFFEAVNLDLSVVTEMLGGGDCSKYFQRFSNVFYLVFPQEYFEQFPVAQTGIIPNVKLSCQSVKLVMVSTPGALRSR